MKEEPNPWFCAILAGEKLVAAGALFLALFGRSFGFSSKSPVRAASDKVQEPSETPKPKS